MTEAGWSEFEQPACLVATYMREDGTTGGMLSVAVAYEDFAGRGDAYFNDVDLLRFAKDLTRFPFEEDECISCSSGLYVGYEHVAFDVQPRGGKGQLVVTVRLANNRWRNGAPVIDHRVSVEMLTSYEYVARFARQLDEIVRGHAVDARLYPDVLE